MRRRTRNCQVVAVLTCLLCAGMLSASGAAAQVPAGFDGVWRAFVQEHRGMLDDAGVVGATVAFMHDGRLVATDYYGMEDIEAGRRVDQHTIYHWASNTKTFTAVGIMQLIERDMLTLDDAIVEYVPELRAVHNPFGPMSAITIRQLLSHSAGFRNPTWPWGGDEPWHQHEPTEWSQLVAMMPYTQILFEPGSRYSYSNPGIIFLGRTLEALTGDVYEAYIDKNIFDVLGMDSSYFDVTPWHLRDARSDNYRVVDGVPVANGLDFNTGITVSNGGLNAPVHDMARWLALLMGAPATKQAVHDVVLDRASLQTMWTEVVTVEDSSALGHVGMGLSFFLYEHDGHRIIGHTGSQKSFSTFIFIDAERDVAMIGAYNTAGGDETAPDVEGIMTSARRRALDVLFPVFWAESSTSLLR
ncbi:MAG: serine hydrolase domain-containing protein [Longimicrobiales bacterium]